jgi:hypothetical protein
MPRARQVMDAVDMVRWAAGDTGDVVSLGHALDSLARVLRLARGWGLGDAGIREIVTDVDRRVLRWWGAAKAAIKGTLDWLEQPEDGRKWGPVTGQMEALLALSEATAPSTGSRGRG